MVLESIKNLFLSEDTVTVNDVREKNKSIWRVGDLRDKHPELEIYKISQNRKGLIFYTSEGTAKKLSCDAPDISRIEVL